MFVIILVCFFYSWVVSSFLVFLALLNDYYYFYNILYFSSGFNFVFTALLDIGADTDTDITIIICNIRLCGIGWISNNIDSPKFAAILRILEDICIDVF